MFIAFIAANRFCQQGPGLLVGLLVCVNYPNTASNQVGSAVRRVRRHVKMPERNTTLDNWKNNQLSIGCDSLDAKIANEIEEKERGPYGVACAEQKRRKNT